MSKGKNTKKPVAPAPEPEQAQKATPKGLTKKQKLVVYVLIAVIAAAVVAAVIVASLALTGRLTKAGSTAVLRSRDADGGFKKFYIEGENYKGLYAVMTVTDGEDDYDIEILLLPGYAPITVANFTQYAEEGFYDGTVFHRIVNGTHAFQGGSYEYVTTDGDDVPEENKTYSYKAKTATHDAIKGEFKNGTGDYDYNIISHFAGVISMARTDNKNSATSGFFLMWEAYPAYDGDYAAFGFIVDPEDVRTIKTLAQKAMESATESSGSYTNPKEPITITKIVIRDTRTTNISEIR